MHMEYAQIKSQFAVVTESIHWKSVSIYDSYVPDLDSAWASTYGKFGLFRLDSERS